MSIRGRAASGMTASDRETSLRPNRLRALARAAPRADLSALEEIADRGDRAHRRERALVIPGADARIEDRVRQNEEELHRLIEVMFGVTGVVSVRDPLRKQIPMAGRQFRPRPVGPVEGDHLLLVGEPGADL